MTPEEFERERRKSAEDLERIREKTSKEPRARTSESVLGPAEEVRVKSASSAASGPEAPPWNPPAPPDLGPVNESWTAGDQKPAKGISSLLDGGSSEKAREAQVKFNADQVQLDNALVSWTAAHFAATHTHYDAVVARMQKRMDDIDTRHRELERELVRHVHEMARRIDVVLGEGEKGRVAHEAALRSIRERLKALEERLR
jgi:hypothetical protein